MRKWCALGQFTHERKPVGHTKWKCVFLVQPILFYYHKWAALKGRGRMSMMEQEQPFPLQKTFIEHLSLKHSCTLSNLAKWITNSLQKSYLCRLCLLCIIHNQVIPSTQDSIQRTKDSHTTYSFNTFIAFCLLFLAVRRLTWTFLSDTWIMFSWEMIWAFGN